MIGLHSKCYLFQKITNGTFIYLYGEKWEDSMFLRETLYFVAQRWQGDGEGSNNKVIKHFDKKVFWMEEWIKQTTGLSWTNTCELFKNFEQLRCPFSSRMTSLNL